MRWMRNSLVALIVAAAGVAVFAQLPGPPVGAPQSQQSTAYGYNFAYTWTPGQTNAAGFRINPVLNLTTATSQTVDITRIGGTIALPNSSASATTVAALHVVAPTVTLNSGTVTNAATVYIDGAPATGTNKYGLWNVGTTRFDGAVSNTALTNQQVFGASTNLTTVSYPASSGAVTLTMPNTTDTIVGRATTDTLTNKTLTSPVIQTTYTISGTGTIATGATITTPVFATGGVSYLNATSGSVTVTPPTGALGTPTLTLPTTTGGLPISLNCGATGTGNQTCSPAVATGLTKVYSGVSVLSSNAAIITFPTAFAATTSYQCVGNDITTRANPVQMISTSTTTATITNTTGASDSINWICVGQ